MQISNFTAQDLIGVFAALLLFSLVLVSPGYMVGFISDLFDFKKRRPLVRLGMSLLLSCAISPVLFFLTYRLISNTFTLVVVFGFTVAFILIVLRNHNLGRLFKTISADRSAKVMLAITFLWIIFGTLILIDIQWGNRLYFNLVAYDYATRTAVVNAITRSGVPPINPGYFPGEQIRLTFLYYFWYILCSLVDQLGGKLVDSRAALISSTIWAGLALMATIALYLRIRNTFRLARIWQTALIGIGLLAVSGLDIVGSTFYIIFPQFLLEHAIFGDIEHWNEQVTAWIGSTIWTPHHLVALLNGILAWLLVVYHQDKKTSQKLAAAIIAGLAFASAFGLSTWVTLIFVIFWIILIVTKLLAGELVKDIWNFFLPGVVGAVVILPFLLDLFGGSGEAAAASPLAFDVRSFWPANIFITGLPEWARMLVYFSLLPLNYFFELGFFLLAGIYWYRNCGQEQKGKNALLKGEIILLLISSIMATFVRSTLIPNNDFGWRGWLPGQCILLIWGTDIIITVWSRKSNLNIALFNKPLSFKATQVLLACLLILGVFTSLQDVLMLRTWPILLDRGVVHPPNRDTYSGEKVFEARSMYATIDKITPENTIVQSEPLLAIDRESGLYGTRNAVISSLTLYGISQDLYEPIIKQVGSIFNIGDSSWHTLDDACQRYSIDVLVIKNTNPLWKNLNQLKSSRQPLFSGNYYAAFLCGRSRGGIASQITSQK